MPRRAQAATTLTFVMNAIPSMVSFKVGGDESDQDAVRPCFEALGIRHELLTIGRDVDPHAERRLELGIASSQMLNHLVRR